MILFLFICIIIISVIIAFYANNFSKKIIQKDTLEKLKNLKLSENDIVDTGKLIANSIGINDVYNSTAIVLVDGAFQIWGAKISEYYKKQTIGTIYFNDIDTVDADYHPTQKSKAVVTIHHKNGTINFEITKIDAYSDAVKVRDFILKNISKQN